MAADDSELFDDIDPGSVTPDDIDEADLREALSASDPLIRQRGLKVCETVAEQNADAVLPFLDTVAVLAGSDNAPIALRAIAILGAVATNDPTALEGRVSGLVGALDSDIVDVRLSAGSVLGSLVVEQPALLAPYARQLVESLADSEPAPNSRGFGDVVDDRTTRQTLQEHEQAERQRQIAGRRTLINVVVAITETEPQLAFDSVDALTTLLTDVDPAVSGGAVDALTELAAIDPAVVAPVSDQLIDCLDHDTATVRARAIRALGYLGDSAAVPKLRTVAENDTDENVRAIAAETAEFLGDTT